MCKCKGFVLGALIGGAIGAIAALLLAPQNGEQTRQWLVKTKEENQDKIDNLKNSARKTTETVIATAIETKDAIEDSLSKLTETIRGKEGDA